MAHEIGHFLGLFHTTLLELDSGAGTYHIDGYDPLSDTSECPHQTAVEAMPGLR